MKEKHTQKRSIKTAGTSIELKCDWDGNFILIDPDGSQWFYPRKQWNEVQKHMSNLVRPAAGDPK